jgi:hypothetical protein
MANSPLVELDKHPEERDVIGRIILAYGELESLLMHVVTAVLNGDTHTAVRSLFRLRSESNRIAVADAISRPWMRQQKLEAEYQKAYAAIRHCMKIHNQYAHCTWLGDGDLLRFGSLHEAAKREIAPKIVFHPISLALLQKQFDYFGFTDHALLRARRLPTASIRATRS